MRLLMIRPPKLVDKKLTEPRTDVHPTPTQRNTTACEPDTELIATASTSGGPLRVRVDPSGWVSNEADAQLTTFMLGYRDAQLRVFSGGKQRTADLSRCAFFRERNPSGLPADCQSGQQ